MVKTKRGRPLIGEVRRERVSFTLAPAQINWLKSESNTVGISRSELLENIIEEAIRQSGGKSGILTFPKIIIPELKIKAFCQKHNIKNLYLFGSVLRADFNSSSDIDILVEFLPDNTPGYFKIVTMEEELSTIFSGRKVDLRTIHELSRYFRDQVKEEAKLLYAA